MITKHFNKLLAQPFNCRRQQFGNRVRQRLAQAAERINHRRQQGGNAVTAADERPDSSTGTCQAGDNAHHHDSQSYLVRKAVHVFRQVPGKL